MKKFLSLSTFFVLLLLNATSSPLLTANENISVNLYAVNIDGSISLQDGALTLYDPGFSNAVDLNDFRKLNNMAENIAIQKNTATLAIEKRQPIGLYDTIFFKMWQLLQKPYQLQIVANNMNHPGLVAYLEDSYLHTATPIDLIGSTLVHFLVNTEQASADMHRFRIVFKTPGITGGTLAVAINSFKAISENNKINIEFATSGIVANNQYILEKSLDGHLFYTVKNFEEVASNILYRWADLNPENGINYYRIKTVHRNGQTECTPVQKVIYQKFNAGLLVFPNPVTSNTISLQMNNLPKGIYKIAVSNGIGQVISYQNINHAGGRSAASINISKLLPNGFYQLQLSSQGMQPQTIKVWVQHQ
jgi:hypothetical protein